MTRHHAVLALFAGSIALVASSLTARAETSNGRCSPRPEMLSVLTDTYRERRDSIGLAANGVVVETFSSASGSWTIIYTRPDGTTCLVASGESFERVKDVAGLDDPA